MRLQAMGQEKYKNGFRLTLHPEVLEEPLSWRKPQMIFVNSMSDLFHENVPVEFIQAFLTSCAALTGTLSKFLPNVQSD